MTKLILIDADGLFIFKGEKNKILGEPEGKKLCTKCLKVKGLEDFHSDKTGRHKKATLCKECANAQTRESYKTLMTNPENRVNKNNKRKLVLQERKRLAVEHKGGSCEDCGGVYPLCVYDFHHVDPKTKDYDPSQAAAISVETMFKELDKCVLLCSNCHRIRHYTGD